MIAGPAEVRVGTQKVLCKQLLSLPWSGHADTQSQKGTEQRWVETLERSQSFSCAEGRATQRSWGQGAGGRVGVYQYRWQVTKKVVVLSSTHTVWLRWGQGQCQGPGWESPHSPRSGATELCRQGLGSPLGPSLGPPLVLWDSVHPLEEEPACQDPLPG